MIDVERGEPPRVRLLDFGLAKLFRADSAASTLGRLTASGTAIMELLSDLHKSGRTVLVVTHDPRMTSYATHTVQLLDGRIVSETSRD